MFAMVYDGPGLPHFREVDDPTIRDSTDAVVRVDTATICGTDLHILRGDVPEVEPGRILGHEAVGTVTAVGSGVRTLRAGDRVLVSCISACGVCFSCRQARYGQCVGGGGWLLGHEIDGTHAESVRVPFADMSTHLIPSGISDEQMLMLADILPTSFEVGVRNGAVSPGDTVAIVGAGPIGLAAVMTARLYSPSHIVVIDIADARLAAARELGADSVLNSRRDDVTAIIAELTGGRGVDVTLEAVGVPETFELAIDLVRPGGHVANIGVHGASASLPLQDIWSRDLTITTGLVDTDSTPRLIELIRSARLDPTPLITHRFDMDEFTDAYDTFARAAETGALKVAVARAKKEER
ncbi:zinc-dependent alcohol dehydrogenase family protein [Nocardia ignorata]|uniref:Alcohol dehydrogenase n=1 Tax=Nocardia ignorata TaxID=145285 RepID=A0A4R6P2P9_NOCIG|nr:zinc-dependent alcohol dehydrogenase family protein [Nocardia ignorata]TDP31807.1 alcohol dehydrogenase [Nocardia ignorata]